MSEDRDRHDRAGGKDDGLGHKLGRGSSARSAELRAGMSQHIPDKVRAEVDGTKSGTVKGKGAKGKK